MTEEEAKTMKDKTKAQLLSELAEANGKIEKLTSQGNPDTLVLIGLDWLEVSNTLSRRMHDLSDDLGEYECHEACDEGIALLCLMRAMSAMRSNKYQKLLIEFRNVPGVTEP